MEIDKLDEPLRDWVLRLKHASGTIEADVRDALQASRDQGEFVTRAENAIWGLIGECHDWLNHFERAQTTPRRLDPDAQRAGPRGPTTQRHEL